MPETIADDSVGIVETQINHFSEALTLECGKTLPEYDIAFETYGELNANASNAILICHALSGDQHAAGYNSMDDIKAGWWNNAIGPGKAIDTNHFFVVCINNLGGCKGSSGPNTINPQTGKYWGPDFPIVTVKDWVLCQYRFMRSLDIAHWCAVIGGSLGGMQVLQWTIDYPDLIKHAIVIAAAPKLSAQNIAFNEVARQSIMSDPDFCDGHYLEKNTVPRGGLTLARMLGHITYLSDDAMRDKFGRELREGKLNFGFDVDFQVESYLRYQGRSFVDRFDANTYLLMTKTLDYFDPASEYGDDLALALKQTDAHFLVISFTSDWRFAPERSREIVRALLQAEKQLSYIEIEASQGHDAFLIPIPHYMNVFASHMKSIAGELL
ncbi:MAG: homoserine O-acetyltransferase [Gammaproteobacteria bacterium]|nr:homoserine O-acetyltransferase [Gammaproteobacteria bacterium]